MHNDSGKNKLLPYDPAVMPLGVYPKELKTYIHTKSCTWVLRAALFMKAKIWKQPRCPPVSKEINKLWYFQWNIIQC